MKNLTNREIEILKQLVVDSRQFQIAVQTNREDRTIYQREVLVLFERLNSYLAVDPIHFGETKEE